MRSKMRVYIFLYALRIRGECGGEIEENNNNNNSEDNNNNNKNTVTWIYCIQKGHVLINCCINYSSLLRLWCKWLSPVSNLQESIYCK